MPENHKGRCRRESAFLRHRDATASARRSSIAERQEWVDAYKLEHGCADCGYDKHPKALDFDHSVPSLKRANVSYLLRYASLADVRAEIAKCQVLCSNCHRIKTFTEREQPGTL